MSQENVETVARLYEAFFRRAEGAADPEDFEAAIDPEIEIRQDPRVLGAKATYHGYEGLWRSIRDLLVAFDDLRFVPEKLTATGDRVVAIGRLSGRGKQSGTRN